MRIELADQALAENWGRVSHYGRPAVERQPSDRLRYVPGLDGLRALAVAAVVVYHLYARWLPGGFLGVDVFFVLSGFLITSLLLHTFRQRGTVGLRTFYVRRARRLLPALFTMLAVVSLVTAMVERSQLPRLRGDVLASLAYSTNWTQILWNRSYFDQLGTPSLLQHLWSLAVEEQFYLLWPLIVAICLATRRRSLIVAVALGAAGISSLLMAVLFHPGRDPSRVYYGTDTHVAPMLLGAALAVVALQLPRRRRPFARLGIDLAAAVGFVVLGFSATHTTFTAAGLYRGGYVIIWLAACAVVLATATPGTATASVLGIKVLRWIGERSYAIYLWHWPILILTRKNADAHGVVMVVAQLIAIVVAADLSYRLIEHPIRTRGLIATMRGVAPAIRRPALIGVALTGACALVVGVFVTAPDAPASIQVDQGPQLTITVPTPSVGETPPSETPTSVGISAPAPTVSIAAPAAMSSSSPPRQRPFPRPVRVAFFGDSQGMTLLLNKPDGLGGLVSVTDATIEGCGVLLGDIHSSVGFDRDLSADCGSWAQLWSARALADRPQIAVVELGAWDVFDDTVDGHLLRFGSAGWDSYWSRQLTQGINALLAAGAQVALLGVPCYRPIAAGGLPRLPERGDDSRTRHVTQLLTTAAARNPDRVFLIHPPVQFCNDPNVATNTAYRWDGVHYYKPGAALMFQVITPQLLAIPQPPPQ